MRRTTRITAALAAAVTTLALAGPAGAAPRSSASSSGPTAAPSAERWASPTAQRPRPTPFALNAAGYATKITGGDLPAVVGRTAWAIINCTNRTGEQRLNDVADVNLPGLGRLGVGTTELWTERKGKEVHVYSRHDVAGLRLVESSIGTLRLGAISTLSHVWHDGTRFRSEVDTRLGGLTFVPAGGGEPQDFPLPSPGQPIEIPGLAKIEIGQGKHWAKRDGAAARGNALRLTFLPTNTRINIAHSAVSMQSGITHGILGGNAYGVSADVADGLVGVGRLPLKLLRCRGTDGKVSSRELVGLGAGSPLADVLQVGVMESNVWGVQNARKAAGWTQAKVANLNLGGGQLVVEGLVAQANVQRTRSGKVRATSDGTTLGRITIAGNEQEIPDPGQSIAIPGPDGGTLAEVAFNVVEKKRKNAITVTALRITLLDGSGLTVKIGQAHARIRKSGL